MATDKIIGGYGALFVGEDKTIRVHVKTPIGASVDITGFGLLFVVRKNVDDANPATISKAVTVSGVFNAVDNPQRAVVVLTDTEMTIARGNYKYSLKRTDDGSETIIARGNFIVEQATQT